MYFFRFFVSRRQYAFTLIEMLISIFVMILLIAIVSNLFTEQTTRGKQIYDKGRTIHDARTALMYIQQDIQCAHRVKVSGGKLELEVFTGIPKQSFDAASATTHKISYSLSDRKILRQNESTGEVRQIAANVDKLEFFEKEDHIAVKIEAEIEVIIETMSYETVSTTLQCKFYPRYLVARNRAAGYFSTVDEDGEY